MTWPTPDVITTDMDAGGDSPAAARSAILDLASKFNQIRNHVSSFMQGLLDDADAATARATLGAAKSGDNDNLTSIPLATTVESGGPKVGYRNVPQNSKSAAYTTVAADAGKHILHPSADTTARTFTIDSNANVPYEIGTAITFINQNAAGVVTIAITSDTMRLAGVGTTGSRTLAANGVATALKLTATEWIISGTGLT